MKKIKCCSTAILLTLIVVCTGCGEKKASGPTVEEAYGLSESQSPVLFHASFDAKEQTEQWPMADYARSGNRNWLNRGGLELVEDGKFGQAAKFIPRNGHLGYDSSHNLRAEKGAISFWFKPGDNYPITKSMLVIVYGTPMNLAWGFPLVRLELEGNEVFINYNGPMRTRKSDQPKIEGDYTNRWMHWVTSWDSRKGFNETYVDGKLLDKDEVTWYPERVLDQIGLGAFEGPHNSIAFLLNMKRSFDEVWVFDRALTPDEVIALRDSNEPPKSSAPVSPVTDETLLSYRRGEVGLTNPETLPPLVMGANKNYITFPFIRTAKALKSNVYRVLDGKNRRFWPVGKSGWSYMLDTDVIDLNVDKNDGFNWVQVKGPLQGTLLEGTKFAHEVNFDDGNFTHWANPGENIDLEKVSIKLNKGTIDEVQLVRVETGKGNKQKPSRTYSLQSAPLPAKITLARYEPRDHTTINLSSQKNSGEDIVHLPAGHIVHFQTGPMEKDTSIGETHFELNISAPDKTAIHLELIDPVYEMRRLCNFQGLIEKGAGSAPLSLLVDHKDLKLRPGRKLWWMMCFDRDVTIDVSKSTVSMVDADPDSDEFLSDQIETLKPAYSDISQGDPSQNSGDPRNQRKALDEIITIAEDVLHFYPENPMARALIHRTGRHKDNWTPQARARHLVIDADYTIPDDGSPEWARVGRAGLKWMRKFPTWWIDNHQAEHGEFGTGPNDDCDLIGEWNGTALIGDPGNKIRNANLKLADFVSEYTLEDGINTAMWDLTHAYEEGTDMMPRMSLLFYGDPVHFERNFGPALFFSDELTGINKTGHRHIRGAYYNRDEIITKTGDDIDIWSYEPGTPAVLIAWYNKCPEAFKVIQEYNDSWLDHTVPGKYGRNYWGGLPVHYETDKHIKGRAYGLRNGTHPQLAFLFDTTGDTKYCQYLFDHWENDEEIYELELYYHFPMSISWYRFLKYRNIDTTSIDKYLLAKDEVDDKHSRPFGLRYEVTGDKKYLTDGLRDLYLYVRQNLPMITEAELAGDRIPVKGQIALSDMYLGGLVDKMRYAGYWYHAASWENCSDDISRFVVEQSYTSLKILLYSYEDSTTEIGLRVWRLKPGTYQVKFGEDSDLDDTINELFVSSTEKLKRYSLLKFDVPLGKQMVIDIDIIGGPIETGFQVDLAISPFDTKHDTETRTLTVPVHNIGMKQAGPFTVKLFSGDKLLQEQNFDGLEAPVDWKPRIIDAVFKDVPETGELEITVQHNEPIDEITEVNNTLQIR
jgi:hypothetical protein